MRILEDLSVGSEPKLHHLVSPNDSYLSLSYGFLVVLLILGESSLELFVSRIDLISPCESYGSDLVSRIGQSL